MHFFKKNPVAAKGLFNSNKLALASRSKRLDFLLLALALTVNAIIRLAIRRGHQVFDIRFARG